ASDLQLGASWFGRRVANGRTGPANLNRQAARSSEWLPLRGIYDRYR
ncbi:1191_t:CDS:2, partial [Acaulospora colombiana]